MYTRLLFCICGIYFFFLTWGVLQERISTTTFGTSTTTVRFTHFVFLNLCQCIIASIISYFFAIFQGISLAWPSKALFLDYLKIACSSSIASPIGYKSLKHINYPTMILGKSCKLVPVMFMNIFFFHKKFGLFKYLTVGLITLGVTGFMFFEPHRGKATAVNSLYGLFLLFMNLLLDGATNACQDAIFHKYRVRAQHMMFYMNLISVGLHSLWLSFYFRSEVLPAISFMVNYPDALFDILAFCVCGAMGQNFIFYTIEHFGSLVLVTVTVTRKLFTILLSLFWFHHHLNIWQWVSVGVVFSALILETFAKNFSKKEK